jgi:hypothetical protein
MDSEMVFGSLLVAFFAFCGGLAVGGNGRMTYDQWCAYEKQRLADETNPDKGYARWYRLQYGSDVDKAD